MLIYDRPLLTKQKQNTQKEQQKPSSNPPHPHLTQSPHHLPSAPSNNIQDIFTNYEKKCYLSLDVFSRKEKT